ncbi:MAG: acyltransferase [Bacteroidia bacterium]|nr:acyltransferase [Bacteroidia bacterium]
MRIKLFIFRIPYGKKCMFVGQTFIFKQKNSSIILGNNLTFRSYPNSNLIGINRNCSLSTLTKEAEIIIGDDCGFSGTVIGSFIRIELGKNVRCGANTLITDSDWHTDDVRAGISKPIKIENNVWLGEGVKVLKGVTIGENSVIGAGSIVTTNIPANVVAAGNPCKVIKSLVKL